MKKILMILLLSLGGLILSGCVIEEVWYEGISPGFIGEYYSVNDRKSEIKVSVASGQLSVAISAGSVYTSVYDYIRNGDRKYYELCEKYGDLKPGGFLYRECMSPSWLMGRRYMGDYPVIGALVETISGINITTFYRWDEAHPAGSSLNDIFTIKYVTYYPFIQSGWSLENPATLVEKPLSELCGSDLKLLSVSGMTLHTSVLPTLDEWCQIAVELVFDTGDKKAFSRYFVVE